MNYFSSSSASTPAPSPNKKGTGNPDDQGISGMIADYSKQIYETANGFYDDVYQRMFSGSEASSNSETVTPDKNAQPNYGQRGHATNGAPVNYYQTSIPKYQQSHSNAYNGSQPYQPRIYTPERGHQHQQYYAPSAPTYGYPSSARSQAQYNHYARQRIADVKKEIEYLDATDLRDRHGKKGRCGYCCPTSRRGKWICGLSIFVVLAIIGVFMFVYLPRSPTFKVMGVDSDPATLAKALTVIQDPNDKTNVSLTLDLTFEISVMNDNRYPVRVDELVLDTFLVPNATALGKETARKKIGFGKKANILFPPQKNSSFFLPVRIQYVTKSASALLQDDVFIELFQACGLDSQSPSRSVRIEYSAQPNIGVLSGIGIRPAYEDHVNINCTVLMRMVDVGTALKGLGINLPGLAGTKSTPATSPTTPASQNSTVVPPRDVSNSTTVTPPARQELLSAPVAASRSSSPTSTQRRASPVPSRVARATPVA